MSDETMDTESWRTAPDSVAGASERRRAQLAAQSLIAAYAAWPVHLTPQEQRLLAMLKRLYASITGKDKP